MRFRDRSWAEIQARLGSGDWQVILKWWKRLSVEMCAWLKLKAMGNIARLCALSPLFPALALLICPNRSWRLIKIDRWVWKMNEVLLWVGVLLSITCVAMFVFTTYVYLLHHEGKLFSFKEMSTWFHTSSMLIKISLC